MTNAAECTTDEQSLFFAAV